MRESRIHVEFTLGKDTMAFLQAASSPDLVLPALPRSTDPLVEPPSASAPATVAVEVAEPEAKR